MIILGCGFLFLFFLFPGDGRRGGSLKTWTLKTWKLNANYPSPRFVILKTSDDFGRPNSWLFLVLGIGSTASLGAVTSWEGLNVLHSIKVNTISWHGIIFQVPSFILSSYTYLSQSIYTSESQRETLAASQWAPKLSGRETCFIVLRLPHGVGDGEHSPAAEILLLSSPFLLPARRWWKWVHRAQRTASGGKDYPCCFLQLLQSKIYFNTNKMSRVFSCSG